MRFTDKLVHALRDMQPDEVLAALGLARRRSTLERWLPSIGFFWGGVVLGVGVGMLFAPMSGQELRGGIARRAEDLASRMRRGRSTDGADDGVSDQSMDGASTPEAAASDREAKRDERSERHRRSSTHS